MATRRDLLGEPPAPIPGRIAVVGVCASGKSALVSRLRELGYDARSCAQEHSFVPDMWQRISRPQVLIYLDASVQQTLARRPLCNAERVLCQERRRLAHARKHCHIYLCTDGLSEIEVLDTVLSRLRTLDLPPPRFDPHQNGREPP